ncbi:HNH endonuclease signature motif containing protein [Mycobacterium sp. SMC-4]|uniref:HNH endonuclease signature motif containing protein n=1 Tax=Mycobacterium sp. SMC-4 TaxID=2857059 RepID=UPI003D04DAEF
MSSVEELVGPEVGPADRLDELFDELAELTGQRNAIDGRIVEIAAEMEGRCLWGMTGARSLAATVAWKIGCSSGNAETIAAVAQRLEAFPLCAAGMREGRLSLDQVGVIAKNAADGSDAHYAQLASVATVNQLRTAVKSEPKPPKPNPEPQTGISKSTRDDGYTTWRITLPAPESARFESALAAHHDGLITDWKHQRGNDTGDDDPDDSFSANPDDDQLGFNDFGDDGPVRVRPPMPNRVDAFLALVDTGWDAEVAHRPHGQRTTVIVHLDVKDKIGSLHLGPLLSDGDRRYLTCDATCEVWFERDGQPIGAGRATRTISRRLRRALERRHPTCAVPGCESTRGLHAHHLRHWEDGGPTELDNLVLLCPYHHRAHHRGDITLTGPATDLVVTDADGDPLHPGSLARPPSTPPPDVPPCRGPLGDRVDWWCYDPFEPPPPTDN